MELIIIGMVINGLTRMYLTTSAINPGSHDDVIKWKHFPRYWPFVRGIHRSPVNSTHKGQWGGALMFSLICVWINGWVNNCEAGDLRRYRAHYDVIVMHAQNRSHLDFFRQHKICLHFVALLNIEKTQGQGVYQHRDVFLSVYGLPLYR